MYMKPPRGYIQLLELEECVTTRFQYFLLKHYSQSTLEQNSLKFEYLTLGTPFDRVGHFTLRLLAAQSEELREFIASSEASFIVERLELSTPRQIIMFLSTSLRHLKEASDLVSCSRWRTEIFEMLTLMKHAFKSSHMNNFGHDDICSQFVFKVPFQMCLKMISKRELLMEKGNVLVPCGKWKKFLFSFLENYFNKEILIMRSSQAIKELVTDERLNELKDIVLNLFNHKSKHLDLSHKEVVRSDEMRELQKWFPPCMANLYNNLQTNHRLSHNARFYFSLFLKDIGMSLNESMEFWRKEYSKPGNCGSKCSHSWQKDSAKYTYSIRHLYGLEGKRANYIAPSCSKIQRTSLGPTEEGGCPFLTFDVNKLQKCLDPKIVENKDQLEIIMNLKTNDHVQACDYYRKSIIKAAKVECSNINEMHKSPVEYFNLLRKDLIELT